MKRILTIILLVTCYKFVFSQDLSIKLKSGKIDLSLDKKIEKIDNIKYYFMTFQVIPTTFERNQIFNLGVNFLEYIPNNTYVVSIDDRCVFSDLNRYNIKALLPIEAKHKLDPKIQNNQFPTWAFKDGNLSIKVLFYKDIKISSSIELFKSKGYKIDNSTFNSISITLKSSELNLIANMQSVWYIEPIDPPAKSENNSSRTLHRSNTINTSYASGRKFNGEDVKIMMHDDGYVGPHIDREGRIDQSFCNGCTVSGSDHGDHVSGTIMGAGNIDPQAEGMANGSFLYVLGYSTSNYDNFVPDLYSNYDVVITSASYSNGCNAGYTSLASDLDQQIVTYPNLIHVFSAGNSGTSDCGYGAGSDWGNVTGGHKQGKNVIAVANLTSTSSLATSSSRGPAADGRIKPDISAKGSSVYSTLENHTYGYKTGTSMSCPAISGVMAQLYQAYKELNGGVNPKSSLMKAILLNSADDLGNPGPDFKYGWGEVNAFQAIKILENNQFLNSSISQGGNNNHNISVPLGTKQLNIMVYWHDIQGSVNAIPALVNDLDINLTNSNGITSYPWYLNTTANASALNSNAAYGNDHVNNMEQITIDNPNSGNYILSVDALTIPFGTQEYWVTYQFINDDIKLTYPIGGEGFVPGEDELIRWDASIGNMPFTLEYTSDGISWNLITNNISSNLRHYNWTVPNNVTNLAKIRISRNSSVDESNDFFTIIGVPQNLSVNWICPDSAYVSWNSVAGAVDYEVSMLGSIYMDSITTTTSTTALVINPNPSITDSWFSVCAKVNGERGRRAVAVNAQSINNGCLASPLAAFSILDSSSCNGNISFIDESFYQPNYWSWDFGDGMYSNLQNPTHTYLNDGTYNVSLFVSNVLGQDSLYQSAAVNINLLPAPLASNDTSYVSPATFTLSSAINSVNWYTDSLSIVPIAIGASFNTPLLTNNTTYYVREFSEFSDYGGVLDTNIGSGYYYYGDKYLIFDSYVECNLVSTDIYAEQANTITFELRNNFGLVIDDTTITVSGGYETLFLDFNVPVGTGLQLGLGTVNAGLYKNNNGAVFPYNISNLVSITGANNSGAQNNWYNYYNLQFKENCLSNYSEATAVFMLPNEVTFVNANKVLIYPNPTNGKFYLSNSLDFKILDILGDVVMSGSGRVIDMSNFNNGVYLFESHNLKEKIIKY